MMNNLTKCNRMILVIGGGLILLALAISGNASPHYALAFQVHPSYSRSNTALTTTISFRTPRGSPSSTSLPTTTTRLASASAGVDYVNIDERSGERDFGSLEEWAAANGVQRTDGFQLALTQQITTDDDDGVDRGDVSVMTTEPLASGSPVLFVPVHMILSSTRIANDDFDGTGTHHGFGHAAVEHLRRLLEQNLPASMTKSAGGVSIEESVSHFYLFLKILTEYENGTESPYYPWLNSLPRLFFNAVSMTDFCLQCLPPLVSKLAGIERTKFENFYEALQKVHVISDSTKNNKDLAKWVFNIVTTRSWGPENEKQIVPMADMFNHGTETEIDVNYDEDGNCILYATKDVPAGSPLRISYGDPTNPSHLFATYGFVDKTSPATYCKIMHINPSQELLNLGYAFNRMLFYKDTGDISEEVWDVTLYQILSTKNKAAQRAFYEAHMNGDIETKSAIHEEYLLDTASSLQLHVDTFLSFLDALSEKAMTEGDIDQHPRLPLILSHNEFVKSTFLKVKSRLDPLVGQAVGEPVYA